MKGSTLTKKEKGYIVFCPRCDREYKGAPNENYETVFKRVIKHVQGQHPDHDPEWYWTY